jgi:hypothetical protein
MILTQTTLEYSITVPAKFKACNVFSNFILCIDICPISAGFLSVL